MTPAAAPSVNGNAQQPPLIDRTAMERRLEQPLTEGYKPTIPLGWYDGSAEWVPQIYMLRDIEIMMTHPVVRSTLDFYKGGIAGAEFWGGPSPDDNPQGLPICANQEVTDFVQAQCNRFWDRGMPKVQGGYEYGWIGLENHFEDEQGKLLWAAATQFSPRDTFLLTRNHRPVGVRVKNVQNKGAVNGQADLWLASKDVPAKGLWYAHEPRYSSFYGQSQLIGAWRPWRRLAWKDGAETVIDTGVYRFAFSGPMVKYPEEDMQPATTAGAPATTLDSQGNPRRYARDVARQMAELAKAGAAIGLPSTQYSPEAGGGDKWSFEWPKHVIDVAPLIGYAKWLQDQISYGIGVPPELQEAAETGSGYSGRAIPMESFIARQQRLANAILWLFVVQVLRPLVRWNFGDVKWHVAVKPLLLTKRKAQAAGEPNENGQAPAEGGMTGKGQQGTAPTPPPRPTLHPGQNPQAPTPGTGGAAFSTMAVVSDRIRAIAQKILQGQAA